jgi:trimeric autotransporter adhesin
MKKLITLSALALSMHFASFGQCAITGSLTVCMGSSTYLSTDSSCTGGTWSSSDPAIAIVSTSGEVTGESAGVTTISYTVIGGSVTTASVTVEPSPAPVTGPTTLCTGATATYSDATSGGHWWSSVAPTVTIDSNTGVATGVAAGLAYIEYIVPGTSCNAILEISVSSSFDSAGGTITGPNTVCSGGSITLACGTPGGVWTSSSVGIATVGSSTGIVTGLSTGVATITYTVSGSCGASSTTYPVTVNPTISAGYLSGTGTTTVGGTFTLTDALSSGGYGTWYSTNPSVATVSSSGVVYGAAVGLDTILYVISGCSISDTAKAPISITALNGISGNVYFSTPYYGSITVWLINFNTSTLDLEAVDSTSFYIFGTTANYYSFTGLSTDSFRVKAAITVDSTTITTGYIPTYHDSAYHWNTANVINYVAGTSDTGVNIHMNMGTVTTGPGFISGSVLTGAGKATSTGVPVVDLLVYVVDQATGVEMQRTYTDASGVYSFSNLPLGTYLIYPELINYTTTAYTSVTLTSTSTSMTAANFEQHNIAKTITPVPAGTAMQTTHPNTITVFPNPSNGIVNVSWNEATTENAKVRVSDMSGKLLMTKTLEMTSGSGTGTLNLSALPTGMYTIEVSSASTHYSTTLSLDKQ